MKEILEFSESFSMNNVTQVFIVCVAVLYVIYKYMSAYFASDIELFLVKKRESQRRELFASFLIYFILVGCNVLLVSDKSFAIIEFLLMIVCLIIMGIGKTILFFEKKDSKEFIAKLEALIIIIAAPLFTVMLEEKVNENLYSMVFLFSLAEMIIVILLLGGFKNDVAKIIVKNNREEYFVYKRLDEERLLCGDDKIMKEANRILVIDVNDVICGEYYLCYYKEEGVKEKSSRRIDK